MEDHLHALVAGCAERADIKKVCAVFRQTSGYHYRRLNGARLWQDGFFDRVLRSEEATFDVVSYVLSNPIRAGLVEDAISYPFAGSSRYNLNEIARAVQWRPDSLG